MKQLDEDMRKRFDNFSRHVQYELYTYSSKLVEDNCEAFGFDKSEGLLLAHIEGLAASCIIASLYVMHIEKFDEVVAERYLESIMKTIKEAAIRTFNKSEEEV